MSHITIILKLYKLKISIKTIDKLSNKSYTYDIKNKSQGGKEQMKDNEKRTIAILVVITVIVIIIAIVRGVGKKEEKVEENPNELPKEEFVEILEDGTKLNTSEDLKKMKTIDGMEITNIQLTEKGNSTLLLGTITNPTDTTKGGFIASVKVLDKRGNEITTVDAIIGEIKPGESQQFSTSATFDYANAYDFEITRKQ